jgi:predicted site-specific integrase-resolvase
MQIENGSPLLNSARASEILGAHWKTLEKWRHQGRGPKYLRLCGRIRYRESDLRAFLESSVIDPATAATVRARSRRRARTTALPAGGRS